MCMAGVAISQLLLCGVDCTAQLNVGGGEGYTVELL